MSKDQNITVPIEVETVEKVDFILNWITSTITFWNLDDKWPTNLIKESCDECINLLKDYWQNPLE